MKKIAGAAVVAIIVAATLAYSGVGQKLIAAPQQIARDAGEKLDRLQNNLATVRDDIAAVRRALSKMPGLRKHGFRSQSE